MKKLLALGISLAMMASLSAVAFAAEGNNTITGPAADGKYPQKGSTEVIVKAEVPTDPEPGDDEQWTVTIPSTIQLTWDNVNGAAVTEHYSIDATLAAQSKVTAKIVDFGSILLKNDSDQSKTLEAKIDGGEGKETQSSITQTATGVTTGDIRASVTAEAFEDAVVGSYTGTVNFEVTYQNQFTEQA